MKRKKVQITKQERTRATTELKYDEKADQIMPQLSDNNIKYQNQIKQFEDQLKEKNKTIEDLTCKLNELYQYKETEKIISKQRQFGKFTSRNLSFRIRKLESIMKNCNKLR